MTSKNIPNEELDNELISFTVSLKNNNNNNDLIQCEDYKKMISGMKYNPMAKELVFARENARKLRYKFNQLCSGELKNYEEEKFKILKNLLGKIGQNSYIEGPFNVDYGINLVIGNNFYANFK